MADVEDFDGFVLCDAEEYLVAITLNDLYSNTWIVGLHTHKRPDATRWTPA